MKNTIKETLSLIALIALAPTMLLILFINWLTPSEEEQAIESYEDTPW